MNLTRVGPTDVGLLVLRLGSAALLFGGHGWPKLAHFSERAATFSDPLGVGSGVSLGLVVFAEVACSLAIACGLFTRFTALPLLFFFAVAVFVQHGADPWSKKELALIYALPFLVLVFTGPGSLSVDAAIERGRMRRALAFQRRA